MKLIYGSVCSGIEAASVAWHPLGWRAAWLAEIEPFPSAVLAHHYPDVPNLGDMTKLAQRVLSGEIEAPDVLVGGTPCQAYSVAGMREGLNDARGQLTLRYMELADAIDLIRAKAGKPPCIIVWENVPGVLSDKTNAFGCFLAGLAGEDVELQPPGNKWSNAGCVFGPKRAIAWRTLDAQYFGLAQRRRRVFLVASARKGFDPCQVLFEWDGMRRDTAPRRESREETAGTLTARTGRGSFPGTDEACSGYLQPAAFGGNNQSGSIDVATARNACASASASGRLDFESETFIVQSVALRGCEGMAVCVTSDITHTLKADGFDGSEDGTGRGQPIVTCGKNETLYNQGFTQWSENASAQETYPGTLLRILQEKVGEETFAKWGLGILGSLQQAEILRQALHGIGIRPAAFSRSWVVHCALSRPEDRTAWLMQSLREAGCERCSSQGWEPPEQLARELGAYLSELSQPGAQSARFMRDLRPAAKGSRVLRQALSAIQEMGRPDGSETQSAHGGYAVRRLTVEECEFLQGFPRGYTLVPHPTGRRKDPTRMASDGPRYKALGNSMAVPVMAWIGKRIAMIDALANENQ